MAIGDGLNNAKKNAQDLNKELESSKSKFGDLRDTLESINGELGKKINRLADAKKAYTSLGSIAQKLQSQEEGSVRLTDKQLDQLASKASIQKAEIERAAKNLSIEKTLAKTGKSVFELNGAAFEQAIESLKAREALTEEEEALIRAKQSGFSIEQDTVNAVQEEVSKRKQANKLLGTSGELLKGINSIAGNFGKAFGLDEVQKKMQKTADEVVEMEKSFGKLRVAAAGFGEAFSQLGNNLLSPTVLLTNMVIGFNKVDKAATAFQQQTGQDMNTMSTSLAQFNGGLVTSAELIEAASDVTKEFGINATAAFNMEDIGEIASMKKELGLSSKEASKLAGFSKLNAGNVEATEKAIISGVNAGNRQNRTAVAHGQVLRDVANVSEGIAISYAGFPDKLAEAATAARSLGMNLGQVDKIAGSLLQFESSIASEMEAELLTGRSLNLEKARELALNNDLAGVAKELASQGITSANFSKMNRIQQEAQAKAMGMSRDEMARMLLQQEMNNGLSEDALNDAQKATLEDMKRVDAQEKFSTAIGKLQGALAPIIGFFADIASNSLVIYSIMGVALVSKIPTLIGGFKSFKDNLSSGFKSIKGIAGGIKDLAKGKGGGALKSAFGMGDKVGDVAGKAGKGVGKAADQTKGIDPKQGSGIKKFLKGLGDGLASIGRQAGNVIKGGLALGVALFSMGAGFALALPLIAGTDPVLMLAFAAGISAIGLTVAVMGKVGKDIIKGALAMGIMGVALIPAAYAFSLLAGVDAASILAFSAAIPILGLSVMALGLIFTNPITMFLFGAGILGLLALGVAIMPLAAAFGQLGDADIAGTMSGISQLASIAPGLSVAASGLYDLAGGLTAVGVAGVLALPVLSSLINSGLIGGGAAGGEDKKEGGIEKVNKNLEKLIALVEAGGDVFIDGSKVGKTLQLSSSTMG
tara:strand:- start:3772 stop:6558 length:2787 start_codon:yes stop_codon:yes gene_type:complete